MKIHNAIIVGSGIDKIKVKRNNFDPSRISLIQDGMIIDLDEEMVADLMRAIEIVHDTPTYQNYKLIKAA